MGLQTILKYHRNCWRSYVTNAKCDEDEDATRKERKNKAILLELMRSIETKLIGKFEYHYLQKKDC